MKNKGFTDNQSSVETPNDARVSEKPLKSNKINSGRVDINVLKSKLQESESKEFKKNLYILSTFNFSFSIEFLYSIFGLGL